MRLLPYDPTKRSTIRLRFGRANVYFHAVPCYLGWQRGNGKRYYKQAYALTVKKTVEAKPAQARWKVL